MTTLSNSFSAQQIPPLTPRQVANFWKKVEKSEGCWLWSGYRTKYGYGRVGIKGRARFAHRVSYIMAYGGIPDSLLVCHHCDVPACVNPEHLFTGTHQDNASDMTQKGRKKAPHGEQHCRAKLTDSQVIEIRTLHDSQRISASRLARRFGVHHSTVRNILIRKRWAHV